MLDDLLGLHTDPANLSFAQMGARGLVVFLWGVMIVRCGDRRLLGKNAGFDMLLVIVLGSVLSRGINGQANFFPSLGVSALLVLFHHLLGSAASRSKRLSKLLKGEAWVLVRDGRIQRAVLEKSKMTGDDLEENLRLNGNVMHSDDVAEARLERNGIVSVVKKIGG